MGFFSKPKKEPALSAEEQMVLVESFLSITTTRQGTSEGSSADPATTYSDILETILTQHTGSSGTSTNRQRST